MNSKTTFNILNSVERFNIPAETYSEKHQTPITDLYYRYEDEPDFDCEFLTVQDFTEQENIDELESEDNLIDSYGDDEWDAEVYDPYLESSYF